MNRTTSTARVAAVVGSAAIAVLVAPTAAHAAPAHRPSAGTAVVRTAHFSPDTPGVDVYLTSYSGMTNKLWQSDVGYGDVTAYRPIKPGLYIVAMRTHGAPASSPAGLKWTLNARAGKAYTVAAAGSNKNLTGVVLRDTLAAPKAGHGLVRVIQASRRAPQAKLVAKPNTVLAADAKFASSTAYANVPAGTWTLQANSLTTSVSTSKTVTVKSGSISSVVVLDAKGSGIQLRTVEDASGAAVAPQGSIDAGAGGTAPRATDTSADSAAESRTAYASIAVGVVLVAGALTLTQRRRARS